MSKKVYNKRIARVRRKVDRRTLPSVTKAEIKEKIAKSLKATKKKTKKANT